MQNSDLTHEAPSIALYLLEFEFWNSLLLMFGSKCNELSRWNFFFRSLRKQSGYEGYKKGSLSNKQ